MNGISVVRMHMQWAHQVFISTTADVDAQMLSWPPAGTAATVASAMAHTVFSEDNIMQGVLRSTPPLGMTEYQGKTGISVPQMDNTPEWVRDVRVDLPAFRAYTTAVHEATDRYLESLSDDDLDREIDLSQYGMGIRSIAWILGALVIGHIHNVTGEISAIKGAHGARGYPF